MPIAELGYRHWTGQRTGWITRSLSIARSEVRIAYESSRLLRRFIVFAWLPILYFCPFFLAIGAVADPAQTLESGGVVSQIAFALFPRETLEVLRERPELSLPAIWSLGFFVFFAYTQSLLSMIVVAIVGPPLIAKDLKSKAFLVYLSKPISAWQYVFGKLATVAFYVFTITLMPALFLYFVGVALSPDFSTLVATLPIVLHILETSLLIALPISSLVLLLSSFTKDRKVATFLWVALWTVGELAFRVLTAGGQLSEAATSPRWAELLSLREMTTRATSSLFHVQEASTLLLNQVTDGQERLARTMAQFLTGNNQVEMLAVNGQTELVLSTAGYPAPVAIAVLLGLSALSLLIVHRRVRRQVSL